jgi:hypothetical protein
MLLGILVEALSTDVEWDVKQFGENWANAMNWKYKEEHWRKSTQKIPGSICTLSNTNHLLQKKSSGENA